MPRRRYSFYVFGLSLPGYSYRPPWRLLLTPEYFMILHDCVQTRILRREISDPLINNLVFLVPWALLYLFRQKNVVAGSTPTSGPQVDAETIACSPIWPIKYS
jgi:hypothetical protein